MNLLIFFPVRFRDTSAHSMCCFQFFKGLFIKERITIRKPFRIVILILYWFESVILPFVNKKAVSERDSCMGILEMRAEAMHWSICAVGTKYYLAVRRSCSWSGWRFAMLVNGHSSNHEPNQEVDCGFQNRIHSFEHAGPIYTRDCTSLVFSGSYFELLPLHSNLYLDVFGI